MAINCGIVGLPNVGKSTIFSALTAVAAESANYPFCTINPNTGLVDVPDDRLTKIAHIYKPEKIIPTSFEFVDIAGLVKGASQGEGLGNTFLANIRETGIIAHVVRCFDNDDIVHVNGTINPIEDITTINVELALADLETVRKRKAHLIKEKRSRNDQVMRILPILEPALKTIEETLNQNIPVRSIEFTHEEHAVVKTLQLITAKPLLYVCNVPEKDITHGNQYTKQVEQIAQNERSECCIICGTLESEIVQLPLDERIEFLQDVGIKSTGLDTLIKSAYTVLGLRTYFTAGPKEVRAWTFKHGTLAPQAAGIIHTDFERGFIRAEAFLCDDLFEYKDEHAVRAAGKLRTEGKNYEVQDGDILHFKFNV